MSNNFGLFYCDFEMRDDEGRAYTHTKFLETDLRVGSDDEIYQSKFISLEPVFYLIARELDLEHALVDHVHVFCYERKNDLTKIEFGGNLRPDGKFIVTFQFDHEIDKNKPPGETDVNRLSMAYSLIKTQFARPNVPHH